MNEEQYAKIMSDIARNDQEHESYNRRLREHDEALKKQSDILVILEKQNGNIERLTGSMNHMEKSLDNVDRRLDAIEKEPGDKWKKVTFEVLKYVLLAIAAAIIGYIMGNN